ncbi:Protein transport protein S9 plasma membrane t-SNARE [Coemansia sp. RSA 1822]|nr:Protein transport protein S9 plasma membrane t-SNARE [Coemansia sp. RSA 638]KAJ2124206.1 Protein transport protein S9 plasma membrane t-SNARE [Coemansia sp. RSA 720]KAJ2480141.1 Protein transport protein S9 plasma membrane t-SNARE [Coemansia sp. RSA 2131]KAJ2543052.1 Protein transport protein S9 plasma membrane t-SNARE [Coemansia sp. RSA 1853]KAJ2566232.1 Protein transport protein S9 plasma membrane t-SNARE [Coemansia sp. RSA 1822]KAJ2662263.1 Protein transport protein S9 plasma membrane t-
MSSYSKGGSYGSYGKSSSYGNDSQPSQPSSRGPPGREQYKRVESSPGRSSSHPQQASGRSAYGKYEPASGRLGNSSNIRSHASNSRAAPPSRYQTSADMGSDEEYDAIKSQVQRVKQDTLETTRNSKRTLEQTDKVARETLVKLGQQTEQILNVDRKMEDTMVRAEDSVDKSHRLQVLSGSIFRPHVKNPFTRKKRNEEKLAKLEAQRQDALRANERNTSDIHAAHRRVDKLTSPNGHHSGQPAGRMDASGRIVSGPSMSRSERSRYMLDDEDPDVENEINNNLDDIGNSVGMLKKMSLAVRAELKAQEDPLNRIRDNADTTSGHVGMASYRLDRIK